MKIKIAMAGYFFLAGAVVFTAAQEFLKKTVVLQVPGMEKVRVNRHVYATVDGQSLGMDLYRPPDAGSGQLLPAVIFINGIGSLDLPGWGQYTGWGRLVAASGLVGITYQTYVPWAKTWEEILSGARSQTAMLLSFIRDRSDELGVDIARTAVWACSANVEVGFPLAMEQRQLPFRCAVFYYGDYSGSPRQDLPVLIARAGLDDYALNKALDRCLIEALKADISLELINYLQGRHAFDVLDDTEDSRAAIRRTIDFLVHHLSGPSLSRPEHVLTAQSLLEWMRTGEKARAWKLFRQRLDRFRVEPPDDPLSFREVSESSLLGVGGDLAAENNGATAIEVFSMAAEAYPESARVFDVLARAQEAGGDYESALRNTQKTIDLLEKAEDLSEEEKGKIRECGLLRIKRIRNLLSTEVRKGGRPSAKPPDKRTADLRFEDYETNDVPSLWLMQMRKYLKTGKWPD